MINKQIIILITLIFLLCIFSKFNLLSDILTVSIIFILSNEIIKNIYYSILVTFIIFSLLKSIVINANYNKYYYENFEDKKDEEKKEEDELPNMKDVKFNPEDLNEKNEINDDTDLLIDKAIKAEHNPSSIESKNASQLTPFEAQKETFELINTVQTLSHTIKQLGPALKEGKKVLDLYKNFKF